MIAYARKRTYARVVKNTLNGIGSGISGVECVNVGVHDIVQDDGALRRRCQR